MFTLSSFSALFIKRNASHKKIFRHGDPFHYVIFQFYPYTFHISSTLLFHKLFPCVMVMFISYFPWRISSPTPFRTIFFIPVQETARNEILSYRRNIYFVSARDRDTVKSQLQQLLKSTLESSGSKNITFPPDRVFRSIRLVDSVHSCNCQIKFWMSFLIISFHERTKPTFQQYNSVNYLIRQFTSVLNNLPAFDLSLEIKASESKAAFERSAKMLIQKAIIFQLCCTKKVQRIILLGEWTERPTEKRKNLLNVKYLWNTINHAASRSSRTNSPRDEETFLSFVNWPMNHLPPGPLSCEGFSGVHSHRGDRRDLRAPISLSIFFSIHVPRLDARSSRYPAKFDCSNRDVWMHRKP